MSKPFWDAVKDRRSIYGLSAEKIVAEERIEEIVRDAIAYTPSAFNSQSTRIILLFGGHSKKLWRLTVEALRAVVGEAGIAETKAKIDTQFASGYGTVLLFEDQSVVDGLMSQFSAYADFFPIWSQHANAMHQLVIWTALEAEGLGASLQHYNPLIDDAVRKEWDVPTGWKLVAQIPFGKRLEEPAAKEISDIDARLKVFK